ncbi:MAG: nicotinate-nucleotide adenylyltransferase [Candidatus Omnitrophica bacterium]|nr:nicotinate-nucleotide adenylyltransferase [Candidatus Omnitrophota bacterium]
MKIGILGGTFNPIHNGHMGIARQAKEALALDKVIFIPAYIPPHKSHGNIADCRDRLAMVRAAIEDIEGLEASSAEIDRKGFSYTVDTLRGLRKQCGEDDALFFIIGSDNLADFWDWKNPNEIIRLAQIIVVERPGCEIHEREPGSFVSVAIEPIPISARDIRDRIRKRLSITGLVPASVEQYIKEHKLYL